MLKSRGRLNTSMYILIFRYLPLAVRSSRNVSSGDIRCCEGKAEVTPEKINDIINKLIGAMIIYTS